MPDPGGSPASETPSLGDKLLSGTLWMFAMRWLVRLLSVVSVVVVARYLDQDDYGIAAMAAAVVALPAALLDLGIEHAIIREHKPDAATYNTAWTVKSLQMAAVAVVVFVAAPWIADFYRDERVVAILEVLALSIFLRGLENLWVVSFRKEMKFQIDAAYEVGIKLLSVIVTISLAVILESYWALIYGQLAATSIRLVLSLIVAPHWPRPTLAQWSRIWNFSQWTLVKGFAAYIVENSDRLILGRMVSTEAVGAYALGREIAEMPITEISMPANRSLGPGFSALQQEPVRLALALQKAIGAVATVAFPVALGLAVTAHELVYVALGEKWLSTAPVLEILSLAGTVATLRGVLGNTLAVTGHIRSFAIAMWFRALVFLTLAITLTWLHGTVGMAAAFVITEFLALNFVMFLYRRHLPQFTFGSLIQAILRPALSGLLMVVVVELVNRSGIENPYLMLGAEVVAGAATYPVVVMVLWFLAGRPDGIERIALEKLPWFRRRLT